MIILGMGSNWQDRLAFLRQAIQRIKALPDLIQIQSISPIYESPALLPPDAPPDWDRAFLNINLLCHSPLSSPELLKLLKTVEREIGRKNRGRWAPREIDIDILARGSEILHTPELSIPHPGLLERPFAYLPLLDLLPHWRYPAPGVLQGQTLHVLTQKPHLLETTRPKKTLTEVMGILNVTPDSFSDGGRHIDVPFTLKTIQNWYREGIRLIDLGAESTRPGAQAIPPEQERGRLDPLIQALKEERQSISLLNGEPLILSVDTRHASTASWAIQNGAQWINDVSGLSDPEMRKTLADADVDVVFMHSLTTPVDRETVLPEEADPVEILLNWADEKILECHRHGIAQQRLIFDPGLGFGKTPAQNWQILRGARRFQELGVRVLIGHSRKSFLSTLSPRPATERDIETAALSIDLFQKGIDYLRVHDPVLNARAMQAWNQVNGVIQCKL
jgi:2-amino-4-hydroxy-6-hydroxymethyldihydropteridine diphosphokinase/dihydropteroate synthase